MFICRESKIFYFLPRRQIKINLHLHIYKHISYGCHRIVISVITLLFYNCIVDRVFLIKIVRFLYTLGRVILVIEIRISFIYVK